MIAVPVKRSSLVQAPLMGAGLGAVGVLFFVPLLGLTRAVPVGITFGAAMFLVLAWMALRSKYGSLQGVVSACVLFVLLVVLGTGAVATAAVLSKAAVAAVPAAGAFALVLLVVSLLEARRVHRALQTAPHGDVWLCAAVDWKHGHLREVAGLVNGSSVRTLSPLWIGALVPNVVLMGRGLGLGDAGLANLGVALLSMGSILVARRAIGPFLARGLYLRKEERRRGVYLVHEDYAQLQALRRGWWLTRWAAPRD